MAKAQEDGAHIGIEYVVVHRIALQLERRAPFLETGIVEGYVQPAVAFDRGSDQALDIDLPRDVGPYRQGLRPQGSALGRGLLNLGLAPAADQYRRRALFCHFQRRGTTDAAAPAR